ncbi:MAG: polysaccharide deacetylase family protein [Verrucomicrobiales bacterium]
MKSLPPLPLLVFAAGVLALSTGCKTPSNLKKGGANPLAGESSVRNTAGLNGPTWNEAGSADLASSVGTKDSYSSVKTDRPFLALTFDDGPHPTHTPRLLDMLKERNVKATFYVVGTNAKAYPEIMRRIVGEGHEIGNHTVTHGNLAKMSQSGVRMELSTAHDSIVAVTGLAPRTMRPPYGAITASQKAWIRKEFGYPSIMWSVDPEDWKKPGASVVTSRLVSGARPGGILLVHDIHKPTIDAIPSALDQLLKKGYQFVTVTQLIAMDGEG